jgi:hypothetical protein
LLVKVSEGIDLPQLRLTMEHIQREIESQTLTDL